MSVRTSKATGSHTHDEGSAIPERGGRPQGIVSGGLLRSPFVHQEAAPPGLQAEHWSDAFDWYSFVCSTCANEVNVSRELTTSLADFATMCSWLYGDPPICSECLELGRGIEAWE